MVSPRRMTRGAFSLWVKMVRQSNRSEPFPENLLVLLDAVLDSASAVAILAEVTVGALDHLRPTMPYLSRHRPRANRLATIKRLETGGDVGVPERLGANLVGLDLPTPPILVQQVDRPRLFRHAVQQLPHVGQHRLLPRPVRREQEPRRGPLAEHVGPQNLLQLRPQWERAVGLGGLESPPRVRPERDRLSVEAHVIDFEPKHFGLASTRQQ